ncbi:nuclear transport factor 2 family protein [Lyngbya confervoides]|uniref:SnoaL-like domain-containing protein n=1 Tax=Lyngbya confervoides BDU141951 TaxID=1574623 RepID=A0ABD4T5T0_9CYAN|nr:nuclear transport factor 2 family protein [Lyngbya confervoides]MCM1984048.1 hypothetical protein [Lyngbya confervoides BDU141951]
MQELTPTQQYSPESMIQEVQETFQAYTQAFSRQDIEAVLSYYAYPIILIDRDKPPVGLDRWLGPIKGRIGLGRLFKALRGQNFSHSELEGNLEVQILA